MRAALLMIVMVFLVVAWARNPAPLEVCTQMTTCSDCLQVTGCNYWINSTDNYQACLPDNDNVFNSNTLYQFLSCCALGVCSPSPGWADILSGITTFDECMVTKFASTYLYSGSMTPPSPVLWGGNCLSWDGSACVYNSTCVGSNITAISQQFPATSCPSCFRQLSRLLSLISNEQFLPQDTLYDDSTALSITAVWDATNNTCTLSRPPIPPPPAHTYGPQSADNGGNNKVATPIYNSFAQCFQSVYTLGIQNSSEFSELLTNVIVAPAAPGNGFKSFTVFVVFMGTMLVIFAFFMEMPFYVLINVRKRITLVLKRLDLKPLVHRITPPVGNPLYMENSGVGGFVTIALIYVVFVFFLYTLINVQNPSNFVIQNNASPSSNVYTLAPPIRASVIAVFQNTTCVPFSSAVSLDRPVAPSYCSVFAPTPMCLAMAYVPIGLAGSSVSLSFPLKPGYTTVPTKDVAFLVSGVTPSLANLGFPTNCREWPSSNQFSSLYSADQVTYSLFSDGTLTCLSDCPLGSWANTSSSVNFDLYGSIRQRCSQSFSDFQCSEAAYLFNGTLSRTNVPKSSSQAPGIYFNLHVAPGVVYSSTGSVASAYIFGILRAVGFLGSMLGLHPTARAVMQFIVSEKVLMNSIWGFALPFLPLLYAMGLIPRVEALFGFLLGFGALTLVLGCINLLYPTLLIDPQGQTTSPNPASDVLLGLAGHGQIIMGFCILFAASRWFNYRTGRIRLPGGLREWIIGAVYGLLPLAGMILQFWNPEGTAAHETGSVFGFAVLVFVVLICTVIMGLTSLPLPYSISATNPNATLRWEWSALQLLFYTNTFCIVISLCYMHTLHWKGRRRVHGSTLYAFGSGLLSLFGPHMSILFSRFSNIPAVQMLGLWAGSTVFVLIFAFGVAFFNITWWSFSMVLGIYAFSVTSMMTVLLRLSSERPLFFGRIADVFRGLALGIFLPVIGTVFSFDSCLSILGTLIANYLWSLGTIGFCMAMSHHFFPVPGISYALPSLLMLQVVVCGAYFVAVLALLLFEARGGAKIPRMISDAEIKKAKRLSETKMDELKETLLDKSEADENENDRDVKSGDEVQKEEKIGSPEALSESSTSRSRYYLGSLGFAAAAFFISPGVFPGFVLSCIAVHQRRARGGAQYRFGVAGICFGILGFIVYASLVPGVYGVFGGSWF